MKLKNLHLKKHNYPGKLIVFEGIDGSGKSTMAEFTKHYFENNNQNTILVKMPSDRVRNVKEFTEYDNSIDNKIRIDLNLTHLTIFVTGDRLITQDTEIIPALKNGFVVICDRYCYTGLVRCTTKPIKALCKNFIKPDLVILASVSKLIAKQRVKSRQNEKNNFYDDNDVLLQIKKFNSLAKHNNFKIINTEDTKETMFTKLKDILEKTKL